MKTINFLPQAEIDLQVNGTQIKVVSLPTIEIQRIYAAEMRLARAVVKSELSSEKDDLIAEGFDMQAWCQNWHESNYPDFGVSEGMYATFYAKQNGGQTPPQNLYQLRLRDQTTEKAIYGLYHHFVRDENRELFFEPAKDFAAGSYSDVRYVLSELILKTPELLEAVQHASLGRLLGFIEQKKQTNEKPEKAKA